MKVAVIGSSEYAGQLRDFIQNYSDYEFAGYVDNDTDNPDVLCSDDEVADCFRKGHFDFLFDGIGYAKFPLRKRLFDRFRSEGIPFVNLIHPAAYVHPTAKMGGCLHRYQLICERVRHIG